MIIGLKNRLLAIQVKMAKGEKNKRKQLCELREMYEILEGKNSPGWIESSEAILQMDDEKLKCRAGKFREFFDNNNEKPTSFFFRLGKEKSGDDDLTQIRDNEGKPFKGNEGREKHINDFYGNLYKKRLDRLIEIEDFLEREEIEGQGVLKKLTEDEKLTLEGQVTVGELEKSLEKSNMNSACGWDGVSYWMIKKYWKFLGPILRDYTNEAIDNNSLGTTFKTGLLKNIPKKGNARDKSDWRPLYYVADTL